MTGAGGCGEIRRALGVYVLGAIGPAQRAVVYGHLAWCSACREELAGPAGLPGRLASVPARDVTRMTLGEPVPAGQEHECPPEARLRPLLEKAAVRRRHHWLRGVAAVLAVAAVAGGGVVAGSEVLHPPALRPAAAGTSRLVVMLTLVMLAGPYGNLRQTSPGGSGQLEIR